MKSNKLTIFALCMALGLGTGSLFAHSGHKTTGEKVDHAIDKVQDKAHEIKKEVTEKAHDVKEDIVAKADEVKEKAHKVAEDIKN